MPKITENVKIYRKCQNNRTCQNLQENVKNHEKCQKITESAKKSQKMPKVTEKLPAWVSRPECPKDEKDETGPEGPPPRILV